MCWARGTKTGKEQEGRRRKVRKKTYAGREVWDGQYREERKGGRIR